MQPEIEFIEEFPLFEYEKFPSMENTQLRTYGLLWSGVRINPLQTPASRRFAHCS